MTAAITSASNPRVKEVIRLQSRRERDRTRQFLIEGRGLIERALERGLEVVEVYHDAQVAAPPGIPAVSVSTPVIDKMSYGAGTADMVAVVRQFPTTLADIHPSPGPALMAVAESIEKPGNLGAMLRTVDAAGGDGLIAVGGGVDPFNPNVVRSSVGAVLTVPLAITSLDELHAWLADRGIRLVATSPSAGMAYWEADLTDPSAIIVGAEHQGLSPEALEIADTAVAIPMTGSVDSLNASVSLALVLYEALRQRAH
jgi:TrmH family RNA methyltransferase